MFISRMPKLCAIPQLVSAPLNPIDYYLPIPWGVYFLVPSITESPTIA